jgi:hypothetical protein
MNRAQLATLMAASANTDGGSVAFATARGENGIVEATMTLPLNGAVVAVDLTLWFRHILGHCFSQYGRALVKGVLVLKDFV